MEHTAYILLQSRDVEMRFDWLGFDGDDCFEDFHVTYVSGSGAQRFDFGPCVVGGLRKLTHFFSDPTKLVVESGFRHPDVRLCEVYREDESYRVVIRFEGSGLHEELHISQPWVQVGAFLKEYDTEV